MTYMTKEAIMNRLHEHYTHARKKGNGELFAIFLQGSQNYIEDLFFEKSDVDSRAVYLPTMRDICLEKDISLPEAILENGEHIDRFDVRKFLKLLKTPGINNYESLFTEYVLVNPKYQKEFDELIAIREEIAYSKRKRFLMAMMGVSKRDLMSLQKRTGGEDYDIERFGYSRKRLSNIIRFNRTVKAYIDNKPFSECLKSMDQKLIHKIRRTEYYTLEEALEIANKTDDETKRLAQEFCEDVDYSSLNNVTSQLEDIFVDLMTKGAGFKV